MFSFRISSIKRTISSKVKGGKRYPKLSDNQVFTVDESKYKTAIVSHQCCPPRLVLPVGGRVRGWEEGGWLGWGRMGVKVTGLTLKRINKNLPTQKFF